MPEQIISNLSGGEVSPDLFGQVTSPLYGAVAQRYQNFLPRAQGPMDFRGGTTYVHNSYQNNTGRIETFKYSDDQSYILEFTNGKLRIYEDASISLETSSVNISGATAANPVVITATSHGFSDGDEVYIASVGGMTELNGRFFRVASSTANTFELQDQFGNDVDGSGFTAYTSGGTVTGVYELTSPYTAAQSLEFQWAGEGNLGYFAHRDVAPYKLTRVSATSWTFATYSRTTDPFGSSNNYPGCVAFYEGRLWWASTHNNPDRVVASKAPNASGVAQYDDYTLGSAADDDAIIFPIASSQGDIAYINWIAGTEPFIAIGTTGGISALDGGANNEAITPTNVRVRPIDPYGAQALPPVANGSTLFYMQKGSRKLRSFEYELLADSYRSTDRQFLSNHLLKGGVIQLAFQRGRDDIVYAVRSDGQLIAAVAKAKDDTSGWHRVILGGTDVKVLSVTVEPQVSDYDRVWVLVERTINSTTVRYLEYFTNPFEGLIYEDYFSGEDNETTDKEDFENEMFEELRYLKYLDSHLQSDGIVSSSTLTPGAVTGTGVTFTAGSSIFTSADVGKEIWKKYENRAGGGRAVITAYSSGTSVTCDILEDFDNANAIAAGSWYLTTDTVGGLYHLEGETIQVLADGRIHPDVTVSGGSVTLERQCAVILLGYLYKGIYVSMPLAIVASNGTTATHLQNIERVKVLFYQSYFTKFGTSLYRLDQVATTVIGQKTDRPTMPFTGVKPITIRDSWEQHKRLMIVQDTPFPCKVNMMVLETEVGDD